MRAAIRRRTEAACWVWVLLGGLGCLKLSAQTGGPTLQATADFINELFAKQGEVPQPGVDVSEGSHATTKLVTVQTLELDTSCMATLVVTSQEKRIGATTAAGESARVARNLITLDPRTVRILVSASTATESEETAVDLGLTLGSAADPNSVSSKQRGLFVTNVRDGSFAASIGLKASDGIRELNRKPISDEQAWKDAVRALRPGDDVVLVITRVGEKGSSFVGGTLPSVSDKNAIRSKETNQVYRVVVDPPWSEQRAGIKPAEIQLGLFTEKDFAERCAKAYIHAIAMCHTSDKEPLF